MRKQFWSFILASLLSVPSTVLAQATWYGSFAGGIESNDGATTMRDFGSLWGVEGGIEISDGLEGVFQFEAYLDLANATILTGDDAGLSYVGLSGGFGQILMGRLIAAPDLVTGIVDNSLEYGEGPDAAELNSLLSYSIATGPATIQLDLMMDAGGNTVDRSLFGAIVEYGNGGALALSYDANKTESPKVTETGLAIQQNFGAIRAYFGGLQTKVDGGDKSTNIFAGFDGSIGDTGLTYLLQYTQKKDDTGKPSPIVLNLTKELGGSAAIVFETKFNDKDEDGNKVDTAGSIALIVDF